MIEGVEYKDMIHFWITVGIFIDRMYREVVKGRDK